MHFGFADSLLKAVFAQVYMHFVTVNGIYGYIMLMNVLC